MNGKIALLWAFFVSSVIGGTIIYKNSTSVRAVSEIAKKDRGQIKGITAKARVGELSEKLQQKKFGGQFPAAFSILHKGKKEDLEIQDQGNYLTIKRPKWLSFGARCVATFFLFDFDDKNVYISKDNPHGIVVCGRESQGFVIYPKTMDESRLKTKIQSLTPNFF